MFAIKRTISKFATHALVKKYMKLKRTNLMNPPTRAFVNFLLKLLTFIKIKIKAINIKTTDMSRPKTYEQSCLV